MCSAALWNELTDLKANKVVDTLEVDFCLVATGRAHHTQMKLTRAMRGNLRHKAALLLQAAMATVQGTDSSLAVAAASFHSLVPGLIIPFVQQRSQTGKQHC